MHPVSVAAASREASPSAHEVADRSGFADVSALRRQFTSQVCRSPTAYRRTFGHQNIGRRRKFSPILTGVTNRHGYGDARPDAAAGSIGGLKRQLAHGRVADLSSLRAWVVWVRV
jgi:hypothetical protein